MDGHVSQVCAQILRIHAPLVGLSENFTIYDTGDSKKVVKQAIENSEVNLKQYTPDSILNHISNIKNNGVTVENFATAARSCT